MKANKLYFIALLVVLVLGTKYYAYGSLLRNCAYSEDDVSLSSDLLNKKLVTLKDAYLAVGESKEFSCLNKIKKIKNEIINSEIINNNSIGKKYFINEGRVVADLKKGSEFKIVGAIAVTKHGITTIDSGSGPYYSLILEDNSGLKYRISTTSFGYHNSNLFLAFADEAKNNTISSIKLLDFSSFDELQNYDGTKSLKYNGKQATLTQYQIENSKTDVERLSDKLKKGEKFLIAIYLHTQENYTPFELSENPQIRQQQVAKIQNEFFSKIPKNLILSRVEKDPYWPNISMDANLELLDYLAEHRIELKIKSVMEFTKLN